MNVVEPTDYILRDQLNDSHCIELWTPKDIDCRQWSCPQGQMTKNLLAGQIWSIDLKRDGVIGIEAFIDG